METSPNAPRFGRVITAMVTPFDADGCPRPRRGGGAGPLAGRPRERRSRAERVDGRELGAHRRREAGPVAGRGGGSHHPGYRRHRVQRHRALGAADGAGRLLRGRRGAGGHAVLQPPLAIGHLRALPGRGRGIRRTAGDPLRHSRPHRSPHRRLHHRAPGPRRPGDRGAQGRRRRPGRHGASGGSAARAVSRSTAATT